MNGKWSGRRGVGIVKVRHTPAEYSTIKRNKKRTRTVPFTYSVEYAQTRSIREAWPNALRLQKHGQNVQKKKQNSIPKIEERRRKKTVGQKQQRQPTTAAASKDTHEKEKKGIA